MTFSATLLSLGIFAGTAVPSDQVVVLQVGRVVTVSGDDIEGATVLIESGRIRAVGTDIEVPTGALVIRKPYAVAMPGIVNCHSTTGLRVPSEKMSDVPFVNVIDGIDPSSRGLENARRDGVTTIHVMPSNVTRFGGQGAAVRSAGRIVDAMVLKAPLAMKISLRPPLGETRMGNMAALRKAFYDLFVRMKRIEAEATGPQPLEGKPDVRPSLESILRIRADWTQVQWDKIPPEKIPERDRPLVDVVRGKLPAFIYCPEASDVFRAFELIEANGLKATLVLGRDAWKLKDVLAARSDLGPVILDADLEVWEEDPESGVEQRHITPLVLHKAGVRFALQALEDSRFNRGPDFSRRGNYHLWYQAATLVKFGIPRTDALRAITLTPAEILGLAHRLGSIEPGKDANIAVFSGDPLDARSWVEVVLVEGTVVYRKEDDKDLELLLRKSPRRF